MATWLQKGLEHDAVDEKFAPGAIGYCFGGMAVIEAAGRFTVRWCGVAAWVVTNRRRSQRRRVWCRTALKPAQNQYNTNTVMIIENGAEITWSLTAVSNDSSRR